MKLPNKWSAKDIWGYDVIGYPYQEEYYDIKEKRMVGAWKMMFTDYKEIAVSTENATLFKMNYVMIIPSTLKELKEGEE